jgi:hypothetical protein
MHQEGGERKGEGRENLDAFNDGFQNRKGDVF